MSNTEGRVDVPNIGPKSDNPKSDPSWLILLPHRCNLDPRYVEVFLPVGIEIKGGSDTGKSDKKFVTKRPLIDK
jgi:hypothetical protein